MYAVTDFTSELNILASQYIATHYPNIVSELTAIATSLSSDPTHHDQTIQDPGAPLRPSHLAHTRFTNDVLLLVNMAKGGNVTPTAISNAITAEISKVVPPSNTTAPAVTGTATVGSTLYLHARHLDERADVLRLPVAARGREHRRRHGVDPRAGGGRQRHQRQLPRHGDQCGRLDERNQQRGRRRLVVAILKAPPAPLTAPAELSGVTIAVPHRQRHVFVADRDAEQ